uniref:6-pyruvoyltetrahydropterin synthase n=1 Tax=Trichuris muris TaxID=70415 RepID=A0A5S6R0X1_TRIMR
MSECKKGYCIEPLRRILATSLGYKYMSFGGSSLPIAYVTRSEWFSASHRLHSNQLSVEENATIFGQCNNPNGHGHNYKVEVTIRADVDPSTGMAINISTLKEYIQTVIAPLDHKHLDMDVAYFKSRTSTTENLAVYIWNQLIECMTNPEMLYEVKVHETDKNVVTYRGETSARKE